MVREEMNFLDGFLEVLFAWYSLEVGESQEWGITV